MNWFIYGARRSGKTTKLVEICRLFPDLPVVSDMFYSRRQYLSEQLGIRVTSEPKGLRDYIRVFDNFENFDGPIGVGGTHLIITATPDNYRAKMYTRAFDLYNSAVAAGWSVIHTGGLTNSKYHRPDDVLQLRMGIDEHLHLGTIDGQWYTKEMLEIDKLKELQYQ